MIHEEICTYEVAKLAKEKGFDVPTHYAYNENCQKAMYMELCLNRNTKDSRSISAPTQSLLQRWLREEKGIVIEVICLPTTRTSSKYEYKRHLFFGSDGHYLESEYGDEIFDTYELALEDAIKYALENLV
jgi:hypothetical protein